MNLSECEVAHRHIRGRNAIILCGPRALSDAECAALFAEYRHAVGGDNVPAYFSPDGWQLLAPAAQPPAAEAAAEPATEEAPLVEKPATTSRRSR